MTALLRFTLVFLIFSDVPLSVASDRNDDKNDSFLEHGLSGKRKREETALIKQQEETTKESSKKSRKETNENIQDTDFKHIIPELGEIPLEITLHILSFMSDQNLYQFSQTSKKNMELVEELFKLKIKEESPLFPSSPSPWMTTSFFRNTLLNFLKEYQARITSNGEALSLIEKMRPFSLFCKKHKLPHDLLIESLWIQNNPFYFNTTVNWADQFMERFLKDVLYKKDPITLELGLLLHSFGISLLSQTGMVPHSFPLEHKVISKYAIDLIIAGKNHLLHELAKTYPNTLLLNICANLFSLKDQSENNRQRLLVERVYLLKLETLKDNAIAQTNLGLCYFNSIGVKQDSTEAVKCFQKAADQGYDTAQYNLGWMYENRKGIPEEDKERADEIAVSWYQKAADQGLATAQYKLGRMYENRRGIPEEDKERADEIAFSWYQKAADQGNASAQYNLARMYESRRGIPEEDKERADEIAFSWYQKAADQGVVRLCRIC